MNRIIDYGKLAADITAWIKDYATSNNIQSLVVGVSGGVDSAVVSTLCALTGIPTWCAILPIESEPIHQQTAVTHITKRLGQYSNVGMEVANLSGTWRAMYMVTCGTFSTEHAWANTKSRLRMTYLYQMACATNGIVVGTGNKVEDFGVKFFSKYGDGGVDISPIGDLKKSEVRELGRYLGVPEDIINAKSTDGLWADGRCDEDQLLCTYDELEWAMDYYEELKSRKVIIAEIEALTLREKIVLERYTELYHKGMHKVQLPPIYKI